MTGEGYPDVSSPGSAAAQKAAVQHVDTEYQHVITTEEVKGKFTGNKL